MLQLAQMRNIFDKLNMIGRQIEYSEILAGFQALYFRQKIALKMKLPQIKERVKVVNVLNIVKIKNQTSQLVILFDGGVNLWNVVTGGVEFVDLLELLLVGEGWDELWVEGDFLERHVIFCNLNLIMLSMKFV